ncbi:hypothetical protein K8374_10015 [Pseudomonas sp. p1(2021b)]|uniref:hypothetical protein n=1 Tax=Pseudomonas sp. p1(2021b) TaxID=2874628 RepID=UPI001CCDC328|nr:hypothetical protein [Pseudomonas sp. p1(2021b)]UBM27258.1 hypothetical protein K8374_10015 [Pseudomonas sp. p1(2021b)]
MSKNTGGPAFPVSYDHDTFQPSHVDEAKRLMSGMTLRYYFAAHAPCVPDDFGWAFGETDLVQRMTRWRYAYAESMLAARVKP